MLPLAGRKNIQEAEREVNRSVHICHYPGVLKTIIAGGDESVSSVHGYYRGSNVS